MAATTIVLAPRQSLLSLLIPSLSAKENPHRLRCASFPVRTRPPLLLRQLCQAPTRNLPARPASAAWYSGTSIYQISHLPPYSNQVHFHFPFLSTLSFVSGGRWSHFPFPVAP